MILDNFTRSCTCFAPGLLNPMQPMQRDAT